MMLDKSANTFGPRQDRSTARPKVESSHEPRLSEKFRVLSFPQGFQVAASHSDPASGD